MRFARQISFVSRLEAPDFKFLVVFFQTLPNSCLEVGAFVPDVNVPRKYDGCVLLVYW